ncbi:kynurenine/alpha-aminoadipate aminotransferase, mitochondrial-like [Patiria miniata]|uniref:Aminotransferase class I/classII large domain-containing protein n=1 Tax=Patiria miniata TaxID=46514 RepID=A0A913ZTV0_PATMI|nr:kynurenine/alpha-aminoadipate aminotransferase, mitochondrial-like [Patiria miniata]
MDYSRFLNALVQEMEPPVIQQIFGSTPLDVDRSSSLGMPNPAIFPFSNATFTLKDGTRMQITEEEMAKALQYGKTKGFSKLLDLLCKMQCEEHRPPTAALGEGPSKMRLLMTPGVQMALLTFGLMCSNGKAPILVNVPSFAIVSAPLISAVSEVLCVDIDADGTNPKSLRENLSRWTPQDAKNPESGIPRILWLNPTCNNPAGVTTSAERRKEIYAIAHEYDLLIVEDDPYYYLQEVMPRVPSYLSLDVDGRVLRFDSFSKIVSPGLRCGYITGPDAIVKKIEYVYMQGTFHTCVMSQMIIYKLLKHWGAAGFEDHVQKTVEFNRRKRLHALAMADKWLIGLAKWNVPPGGMYILFRVYDTGLTSYELNDRLIKLHKVTMAPASGFYSRESQSEGVATLRVSITMADEESMEKAIKGLGKVIQEARNQTKGKK